jgi:FixJ family two-component response regulator
MPHFPQAATVPAPIVYIVDDDSGMRTSLAWLLESVGVKSAGFANASEFLAAFDVGIPACLVLDVRMPEQSGFDVQAELNRRGATLPIIFVSGHGDIPMSVRALQNGAIDFVEKPYNSQQMLDRVQRALKLAAQRNVAAQKQRELRKRIDSLTAREMEVLRGVIDGKGSKRIASCCAFFRPSSKSAASRGPVNGSRCHSRPSVIRWGVCARCSTIRCSSARASACNRRRSRWSCRGSSRVRWTRCVRRYVMRSISIRR